MQPKEKVFGPDIPWTSRGHSCRRPGSKSWGKSSKLLKTKHSGADMHDTNAWTSMTPGARKKDFGLIFGSRKMGGEGCRNCLSGRPKGGHLKGGHLQMGFRTEVHA